MILPLSSRSPHLVFLPPLFCHQHSGVEWEQPGAPALLDDFRKEYVLSMYVPHRAGMDQVSGFATTSHAVTHKFNVFE